MFANKLIFKIDQNNLPNSLQIYIVMNIIKLPENLPNGLQKLYCYYNQITKLPENLPNGLQKLYCSYNQIIKLPENLPNSLQDIKLL